VLAGADVVRDAEGEVRLAFVENKGCVCKGTCEFIALCSASSSLVLWCFCSCFSLSSITWNKGIGISSLQGVVD
jgi:hypothetical protein